MNRNVFIISIILLTILISSCSSNNNNNNPNNIFSLIDNKELNIGGDIYGIFDDGNLYKKNSNKWEFVLKYYDPQKYKDFYSTINNKTYFVVSNREKILAKTYFFENFENKLNLNDLIATNLSQLETKGWTMMTLQSPKANTVNKYNKLKNCILKKTCDFLENRVDIVDNFSYTGKNSIRFFAVNPISDSKVVKTSISIQILYFKKGDDLWFSGKYYLEKGMPVSITDFENTNFYMNPGPRLIFSGNYLSVELKGGEKPIYRQKSNKKIIFPKNQWVDIKVHFKFSEKEDGVIEVWQDGIKIINSAGINLPISNSIQNKLEIGITASNQETIMYMDDIIISNTQKDLN